MTESVKDPVAALARRAKRVEAAAAVQTVLARFVYRFAAADYDGAREAFTDGARVLLTPGHSGSDVVDAIRVAGAAGPGALREWAVSTPLVWVDADAERAHGVFLLLAAESTPRQDDLPSAEWMAAALDVSFQRVGEAWLIDSLELVPRFRTPFGQDWATTARVSASEGQPMPGYSVDAIATVNPPLPAAVVFESLPAEALADPEIAALEERIAALEDRWAIENLMSTHEYLHAGNENGTEFDTCFAHQLEGLAFEPEDWGVWDGARAIEACYVTGAPPAMPGLLTEHTTTTPVIEIARDGRTARGVWLSPGHETFAAPDGNDRVVWSWGRYGVDFAKVDGAWRFWRFHIYTTFRTEFDVSWVDSALAPRTLDFEEGEVPPGMEPPSRRGTANAPYHPERGPQLLPEPPQAYDTWDEANTYIPLP